MEILIDTVLGDLVDRGQSHGVPTPLLAAAVTALRISNHRLARAATDRPG